MKNWRRVIPSVLMRVTLGVPVVVDTYKPEVMQQPWMRAPTSSTTSWALRQPAGRRGSGGDRRRHPSMWRLPDAHAPRSTNHAGVQPCGLATMKWQGLWLLSWTSDGQSLNASWASDRTAFVLDPGIGLAKHGPKPDVAGPSRTGPGLAMPLLAGSRKVAGRGNRTLAFVINGRGARRHALAAASDRSGGAVAACCAARWRALQVWRRC